MESFEEGGEESPTGAMPSEEGKVGGEVAGRKMYMCLRCGRVFSPEDMITPGVHCPYCGYRVIIKVRTFQVKRIAHIE
jgi:DNA-directed RNA polymerase subunit P